jgi:hypothetical protein
MLRLHANTTHDHPGILQSAAGFEKYDLEVLRTGHEA